MKHSNLTFLLTLERSIEYLNLMRGMDNFIHKVVMVGASTENVPIYNSGFGISMDYRDRNGFGSDAYLGEEGLNRFRSNLTLRKSHHKKITCKANN